MKLQYKISVFLLIFSTSCFFVLHFRSSLSTTFELRNFSTKCSMKDCFCKNKCPFSRSFKAFVYPNKNGTKAFNRLIYGKEYFTDDPNRACVFLYFLNKDERNLEKLKYWGKRGENHVIINLDNYNFAPLPSKFPLVVQPTFLAETFRPGFDLISPLYNETFSKNRINLLGPRFPLKRKYLISYTEIGNNHPIPVGFKEFRNKLCQFLKSWSSSKFPGEIYSTCYLDLPNSVPLTKEERQLILVESVFTILYVPVFPESNPSFQQLLLSALYAGTIPILLTDNTSEMEYLPLNEYVVWEKILLMLPTNNIEDVGALLESLNEVDINQMKSDGRYAVEMLLSDKGSILACVLETIIKRLRLPALKFQDVSSDILFVRYPKGYVKESSYQQPSAYNYGHQSPAEITVPFKALSFMDPNLGPGQSKPAEKFTILVMTYHREQILKKVLEQYNNLEFLDRIILVWNAIDTKVNRNLIPEVHVPIYVISSGMNTLNNRLLPYDVIRTQAVFVVDDDVYMNHTSLLFAFSVWRENRDGSVGHPSRFHEWSATKKKWIYHMGRKSFPQSMILTKAKFFHKHYCFVYTYLMNPMIREIVHKMMNCDDIATSMLIAHVSKKPPIRLTQKFTNLNRFDQKDGLSTHSDHLSNRTRCLNDFAKIFGYMPLQFTHYIADYLSYQ